VFERSATRPPSRWGPLRIPLFGEMGPVNQVKIRGEIKAFSRGAFAAGPAAAAPLAAATWVCHGEAVGMAPAARAASERHFRTRSCRAALRR
jgi:hypothetical protein